MARKLIFFINPISGTKNKQTLARKIEDKCQSHQFDFEIMPTNKEGDYNFLPEKIIREKITDIIICGGDGTIKQVTSFLLGCEVTVGVIPVGSGNGLALGAGIGANVDKALDIIMHNKASYIDGFLVNGQFGCMLAGTGFDAKVAYEFSKQKTRGLLPYVKLSLQHFFSSKGYSFVVEWNGHRMETTALFISVANSNQFGSRIRIAPGASLSDGLLDIVVVHSKNKLITALSLLRQISFGKIRSGNEAVKRNVSYFHTDHITIQNPQMAPLHIDGEPTPTEAVIDIKIIRNAFRLLLP